MRVKILSQEEYEHLKETQYNTIVSELDFVLLANQIVAVELPDGTYKVLKFQQRNEEKAHLIVTKEQMQQFIFLYGI